MRSTYPYKVFDIVANTGKISHAADILHLTPSAVSHTIQTMEEEFGFALLRRNNSGVYLTENGTMVLSHIRSILREQDALNQRISEINGIHDGTLKIGAFYGTTMAWLRDIFSIYKKKYPRISIEFYQGGYDDMNKYVKNNMVDISFTADTSICDEISSNGMFIPLYRDEMMCIVPIDFPIPKSVFIRREELEGMPLILHEKGEDYDDIRILSSIPNVRKSQFYIEDDNCIMAMVEAGLGVAFIGNLTYSSRLANVKAISLEPKSYRTIGLYIPNYKTISPAAEKMRDCIIEYVSKLSTPYNREDILCTNN